ncbi:type IV pilus assembly protein PilM [Microbacterium album]|uniref:Pilus assembly protein PilM n=1 Tax=Microbacterium album TaxID=2053191 RepID=A0A917IGN6_9MICO|nr:type IV pilus assembly protein PilM [Microbacterium album]GGH50439.1 pilus assembly protein PilM [Microbacterium album]
MGNVIGLDFGSRAIRAIEMSRLNKPEPRIERFGEVRLPTGAIVDGEVAEPNTVADALQRLWRSAKFSTRDVAIGIGSGRVVARPITIDDAPPAQVRAALPMLVEDLLPFPAADALMDFYPSERVPDDPAKVRGLLIAAAKGSVDDSIRAVRRAKLHTQAVDLIPFALARVYLKGRYAVGTAAQIEIGRTTTSVMIVRDGVPQFLRFIPSGGDEVQRQLAVALELEDEDAERLFLSRDDSEPHVRDAFQRATLPLVNAINNTLYYYANTHPAEKLARVYLTGGGARMPGVREQLELRSETWVSYADPLYQLQVHPRIDRDKLLESSPAVAIGLAMGGAA